MSNIVLANINPKLPAVFQQYANQAVMNELTDGVQSGFPLISYKGKVWRIRAQGEETMHLDAQGNAAPTIDVVLVQGNPGLSKIFYDKAYEEGSNEAPRCFSNSGGKPDPSVQSPISPVCATCPNNVWGSRITPAGKKAKLCQDARRVAVVFAQDLLENGEDAVKYLLRIPPASLNPLKDYAEKTLGPKGIPPFAVATRIGFDPQEAHPQFRFAPARLLNDDEAVAIVAMRGSPDIQRVLAEQEFAAGAAASNGAAAQASANASGASAPSTAPAATTAPAAATRKVRPATEEEAGDALLNPVTPPKQAQQPAAAQTAAAAGTDPLAAPPPASPRKRKPAAAAAPVAAAAPAEEEEEVAPPPAAKAATAATAAPAAAPGGDFDNLLDSILNG